MGKKQLSLLQRHGLLPSEPASLLHAGPLCLSPSMKETLRTKLQNMKSDVLHHCQGRAQCKELNSTDSIQSRTFPPLVPLQDKLFPVLMLDISSSYKGGANNLKNNLNKEEIITF